MYEEVDVLSYLAGFLAGHGFQTESNTLQYYIEHHDDIEEPDVPASDTGPTSFGDNRIEYLPSSNLNKIKEIRNLTKLPLKDAKDLVDDSIERLKKLSNVVLANRLWDIICRAKESTTDRGSIVSQIDDMLYESST